MQVSSLSLLSFAVVLCFLSFAAKAQHKVLVSFENEAIAASTLSAFAKTEQSRKKNAPVIHQLRSSGATHIAYISSSRTASDWDKEPGVTATQESNQKLEAREVIPNDPYFMDQWNMDIIDVAGAWEYSTGGTSASGHDIVVGVIEVNGFQLDHPELVDNYYINTAEIANNGIDDDNNGYIDDVTGWNFYENRPGFTRNSHGVHVCATLAAKGNNGQQIAGINWDLSLLPFEIDVVEEWILALDYLTSLREKFNRSNGIEGAFVVATNMSLGLDFTSCSEVDFFNPALERAGNSGILLVASVANEGSEITANSPDFPSTCQSEFLVVVTASDDLDQVVDESRFSTEFVDIAAPGATYRSVDYTASNTTFSGTSGAAPHVAGAIALMYSINCTELEQLAIESPAETARLIKTNLLLSVDKNFRFRDKVATGGRLNIRKAMETMTRDINIAECVEPSGRCELLSRLQNPMLTNEKNIFVVSSPGSGNCRVLLSDVLGRVVLQTDALPEGLNYLNVPVEGFATQMLYLQVGDLKTAKGKPIMLLAQ